MTQTGLSKRVVEALGLCSKFSTAISSPAEASPLPKDVDGTPATENFNYAAIVGMMLYLSDTLAGYCLCVPSMFPLHILPHPLSQESTHLHWEIPERDNELLAYNDPFG